MSGDSDEIRRAMIDNDLPALDFLVIGDGPTWSTEAFKAEFEALGFLAPYVVVKRRSDGVKGTMEFIHDPRVYFGFEPD